MRLSSEDFEAAVAEALAEIPPEFEPHLEHITVDIEPMPDRVTVRHLGLRSRRHLLGLFHGVPLTKQSVTDHARLPSRVTIYRDNIRRVCRTRRQVVQQVRETVLHEIGHHFGLGEADLADLGYG